MNNLIDNNFICLGLRIFAIFLCVYLRHWAQGKSKGLQYLYFHILYIYRNFYT